MNIDPSKKYKGNGVFVKLPKGTLSEIDKLVEKGDYLNRTHLVRRAVEQLLEKKQFIEGENAKTMPSSEGTERRDYGRPQGGF
jgi:Arc/MetJ-type ribon-helix-helix transcriptional regulator